MAVPTAVARTFAAIGSPAVSAWARIASLADVAGQTFRGMFRRPVRWREIVRQAHHIGNRSLAFITVTVGVLGLISVFQVATQMAQILPDYTMLGAAFIQLMVREFAPTIAGLMIATRVGSGIAAEIGSMVVTEQVDALRMSNADPVRFLIVPRTIAAGVMMVALSIYAVAVATAAGMWMAQAGFGVSPGTFLNLSLVGPADLVVGLVKALAYGLAIPIVAGEAGLTARGGSAGVGWATTRAVVASSFAIVVLDFVITALSFVVLPR